MGNFAKKNKEKQQNQSNNVFDAKSFSNKNLDESTNIEKQKQKNSSLTNAEKKEEIKANKINKKKNFEKSRFENSNCENKIENQNDIKSLTIENKNNNENVSENNVKIENDFENEDVKNSNNGNVATNNLKINNVLKKDKLSKKKIVIYALKFVVFFVFCGIAVAGGFIVGDLVIGKIDTFDPTKYDAQDYHESEANIQKWSTKNIADLTPTQIFAVAQKNIKNCEYYSVKTMGYNGEDKGVVVTLGMKQDLSGYRFRNYDDGYFDYFSTGLATVVKKTEFKFSEDKFYTYEGKMNGANVDWTLHKPESGLDYRTKEEYKKMVGCDAQDPIDYIVSTKTVLEEKTNEKVGDFHSFTLKLSPETAVLDYVVKMDYMSGFGYPKFSSIELRFEVDDNMNFQNIYINESYKVIGMSANSKYKMKFSYENIELR